MTDLVAARSQMALSLAFHIVFAIVGMAMPLLMVLADYFSERGGRPDPLFEELSRRWARGTAILFAVGAVSGTVLSFELGLLWPRFMAYAGPVVGMPFSLEGFAFFLEAIALGIYLYGRGRVSRRRHLAAGLVVAVSGAASGALVVCANAFMNTPAGFRDVHGHPVDIDVFRAMANPAAFSEALHMLLAAYASVGFAVAGIHAYALLRVPKDSDRGGLHRRALVLALWMGGVASLLQPLSGDHAAKTVAATQPVKLAALEGHFHTERRAPLRLGGWPDEATETTRYAIELPGLLSVLAFGKLDAEVAGLDQVPRSLRPPVPIVHVAFQIMVACGGALAALALWAAYLALRRRPLADQRLFLWALVAATPLGVLAVEAGWVVTEVGRQPWIIQGYLKTADAVTPMPNLWYPFWTFTALYVVLAGLVVILLRRHVFATLERRGDPTRRPPSGEPRP